MKVRLHTSGTTGEPKPVEWDWQTLVDSAAGRTEPDARVLCCYHPATMAGLQVVAHCAKHDATLILPPAGATPGQMVKAGEDATHVCCTPSQLKQLLLADAGRMRQVRQVTLGGEHATQAVLDAAKDTWPGARVTHIYATSELGAVFSVSDGLEGIPVQNPPVVGGCEPLLDGDGRLGVRVRGAWHLTGDAFDVVDGRAIFRGRMDRAFNVGGALVHPETVERRIAEMPGVRACRVFARPNAVTGNVVACEVEGDVTPVDVRMWCDTLPRAAQPVDVRVVERVGLSAAGKART